MRFLTGAVVLALVAVPALWIADWLAVWVCTMVDTRRAIRSAQAARARARARDIHPATRARPQPPTMPWDVFLDQHRELFDTSDVPPDPPEGST